MTNDPHLEIAASCLSLDTREAGDEYQEQEGKVLIRLHRFRERKQSLAEKKKEAALKTKGVLICEICDFNFQDVYGYLGKGFIEAHHIVPLAQAGEGVTQLADLALVCSNCHRILHRFMLINSKQISPAGLRQMLMKPLAAE